MAISHDFQVKFCVIICIIFCPNSVVSLYFLIVSLYCNCNLTSSIHCTCFFIYHSHIAHNSRNYALLNELYILYTINSGSVFSATNNIIFHLDFHWYHPASNTLSIIKTLDSMKNVLYQLQIRYLTSLIKILQ